MPKRKPTKHADDIRRNLRKSAEINPAQSPHEGIHTCSKGCKKPGCNRGLRDTIEEQDAQIEALKQDLKEQAAAVRHLRMECVHDLNHIGGQQEELAALRSQFANSEQENARLKAEVERLESRDVVRATAIYGLHQTIKERDAEVERLKAVSTIEQRTIQGLQQTPEWSEIARLTADYRALEAENARLRASSFVTAVPVEQYEKLKAELERIYKLDPLLREAIASAVLASKEGRPAQEYVGYYPNPVNLVPIKPAGDDKKGDAS